jgi:two-component system, response regulator PdtaR
MEADCLQLAAETKNQTLVSHLVRMSKAWADLANSEPTGAQESNAPVGKASFMLRPSTMTLSEDGTSEKNVVLVVEDEPIIQMEAVQVIKDAGYVVLHAANTDDAMTILEERPDIRAVFTEIRVPGRLNGMDLARAIAERWPLIRLIVTSSASEVDNFPADWRYIQKVYDGVQIVAALRALFAPRLTVVN